jgi:hypothetical protein
LAQTNATSAAFVGELGSRYAFSTVARDRVGHVETAPAAADTQTMVADDAPLLGAVEDLEFRVGDTLWITNTVEGTPIGEFQFWLGHGGPAGATVNPTNGVFRWMPSCSQASREFEVAVWMTDTGNTNLMDAVRFRVQVGECVVPQLGRQVLAAGASGRVPVHLISSVPLTRLEMTLHAPADRMTDFALEPVLSALCITGVEPLSDGLWQLTFVTCTNQWLIGTQQVAWLHFRTLPEQTSAFVALALDDTVGKQADGTEVRNFAAQEGRVVVVGAEPLLEAVIDAERQPGLVLYGPPGADYVIEVREQLGGSAPWQPTKTIRLTDLYLQFRPSTAPSQTWFFRALRLP